MSFSPSKEIVWAFYLKIKRERSADPHIYVRLVFFFFSSNLPIHLSLMQLVLPLAVVLLVSYSSRYSRCNGAVSLPLVIVAGCYSGLRIVFCCCCYRRLRVSLQQLLWLAVVAATADWGSDNSQWRILFFQQLLLAFVVTTADWGFSLSFFPPLVDLDFGVCDEWWLHWFPFFFFLYLFHLH